MESGVPQPPRVAPWARVLILVSALIITCLLSLRLTGSLVPISAGDALIFQNALLLVSPGSAILEHKFTRPADSVVNSLMGIVTLVTVYPVAPRLMWWVVTAYCGMVLALATVCTAVSSGPTLTGWRATIAQLTYHPAVLLGKARLLYAVLFLFGVFSFYGVQAPQTATLLLFWGVFVAIWPLGLPELLSGLRRSASTTEAVGRVLRTNYQTFVRVGLNPNARWDPALPKIYQQADGRQCLVVPLYAQVQEEQLLGTGLCVPYTGHPVPKLN